MSGTMASFNTALSALRYNSLVMDVASGNVANVGTEGYARRRVDGQSVGAPTQPAMWSRYESQGDGVRVAGLTRMVDPLLDARSRREHGLQSYLDVRQTVLDRVETGLRRARRPGRGRRDGVVPQQLARPRQRPRRRRLTRLGAHRGQHPGRLDQPPGPQHHRRAGRPAPDAARRGRGGQHRRQRPGRGQQGDRQRQHERHGPQRAARPARPARAATLRADRLRRHHPQRRRHGRHPERRRPGHRAERRHLRDRHRRHPHRRRRRQPGDLPDHRHLGHHRRHRQLPG